MSFGQSHRQLVENTNQGAVEPTSSEQATSQAQVGARETRHLGGEHEGLAALVNLADTASKPIVAEANRKKELEGYDNAGEKEGQEAADSAADVWHNRIFGANASLRGAQERIAEDNSRRIYLKAQDLLENGGADAWTEEEWKEWKDKELEDEIGKYKSEGMKDHITSTMGRDFQNLERDRTWKHKEYLQAENRKSTLQQAETIAETFNKDRGSHPQRAEEDAALRLKEINKLQEDSGMSDKAFASAMAQIASDDLVKGNQEFAEYLQEEGFLDDLSFEDQKLIESAIRVNEIKNGEEFGNRSNEIYGPQGLIAQGNVNSALAAYDSLVADFPEAIPKGGRNAIRQEVRQAAWGHAEAARHREERARHATDIAASGINTPFAKRDQWNNITGYEQLGEHERLQGMQTHLAERNENIFHAQQKAQDASYEPRPLTSYENQEMYMADPAYTAKVMEQNGLMLPEVTNAIQSTMSVLNHDLEGLTGAQTEKLKHDLDSINTMMFGNPAITRMFAESLGDDFGKLQYANEQFKDPSLTAQALHNHMAVDSAQQRQQEERHAQTTTGTRQLPTSVENNHVMSDSDMKDSLKRVRDGSGENRFLLWGRGKNDEAIEQLLADEYSKEVSKTGGFTESQRQVARNNALATVSGDGAYISTGNGKEFTPGIGALDKQAREAGYTKGGLDEWLKEVGNNQAILDDIEKESARGGNEGIQLSSMFGNALTSDGAAITDLGGGYIAIEIPRDESDAPPFVYQLKVPHPSDPQEIPMRMQEDIARTERANDLVNESEAWREGTGNLRSPREELDRDLSYQLINEEGIDNFMRRKGIDTTQKRAPRIDDLVEHVTQDEIDDYLPAHEYNKSLNDRQADAVTSAVSKQRKKDDFFNNPRDSARGWNHRRKARRDTRKQDVTEYQDAPDVLFYREGDNREELQERQKKENAAFNKKQAEVRQAVADSVRQKVDDEKRTRLR